jgi:hypothetical protein
MKNGRCDIHGGKTPSGRQWHVVQYPDCSTPEGEAKFQWKLRARAKADAKRAAKLAAMTPAERTAHEAWHQARRPGLTKAARKAERVRAQQNVDVRGLIAQQPSEAVLSPDVLRIREALAAARADLARLEARPGPKDHRKGVFE